MIEQVFKKAGLLVKPKKQDQTGIHTVLPFKFILSKKKNEADSTSGFPQQLRSDKKNAEEKRCSESLKDGFTAIKFSEADKSEKDEKKKSYKVRLIQEGLGNLRDCFYYTREALESGVAAFEGKKCYMDHPSKTDELDRPERTTRDIIGHFENCRIEDAEDGSAQLCADLFLVESPEVEHAKKLIEHALDYSKKYPDQDFVGLSINASGDAESKDVLEFLNSYQIPDSAKAKMAKAMEQGVSSIRIVNQFQDAVSTDLVTEAGAKGKFLESFKNKENNKMAKKDILPKEAEEKKENEEMKKEAEEAAPEQHDDAEQDKALILQMIKKYMAGQEDPEVSDEEESEECSEDEACMKAYDGYKEMGYDHESSIKQAAHAMKLAKHMAAKQSEAKQAEESEAKKEAEENKAKEAEEKKESEENESEESHKESATKLEARIAFLEAELNKEKLEKIIDKKLMESKLPRSVTDKIRAKNIKSEKVLDETIKIYVEAFKEAGEVRGESKPKPSNIFMTSAEKQSAPSKPEGKTFSFANCKK